MHSSTLFVSLLLIAAPFTVLAQFDMYMLKDPQIFSISNGYEVCDYWSNTWFSCFESPFFQANCISTQTSSGAGLVSTFLKSINLRFLNPLSSNTEKYTVTDPSQTLQSSFDSGNTDVNDINGNPWLAFIISIPSSSYSKVIIKDYNTLSTITIEQYGGTGYNLYNLFITTDPASLAFATGILVSGCPSGFLDPFNPYGRRRRSIPECEKVASLQKDDDSNSALSSEIIQKICEHDIKLNPNVVKQLPLTIKAFAEHKEIHNKVIEYGKEKQIKKIKTN